MTCSALFLPPILEELFPVYCDTENIVVKNYFSILIKISSSNDCSMKRMEAVEFFSFVFPVKFSQCVIILRIGCTGSSYFLTNLYIQCQKSKGERETFWCKCWYSGHLINSTLSRSNIPIGTHAWHVFLTCFSFFSISDLSLLSLFILDSISDSLSTVALYRASIPSIWKHTMHVYV